MAELVDARDFLNMKIYGPYKGKDNRLRCVIVHSDGRKQTISYPRLVMETHLGRSLLPDEDVHHVDEDTTNNNLSNLEVKLHTEHCRNHSIKYRSDVTTNCIYCGKEFIITPMRQRYHASSKKAGPFCSRMCSGKYGTDVQRAAKQECLV